MIDVDIAEVKKTIAHDSEGRATRAIVRSLREAAEPLSRALLGSLSAQEQRLSRDLAQSIEKAERALIAAWERMHPGRQWQRDD